MPEERYELAAAYLPMLSPEHIQPQDYARPLLGVTLYSLFFTMSPLLYSLICGNFLSATFALGMSSMMIGTFLISAMVHHFVWWRRLKTQGSGAFVAIEDLDLPLEEAFELCLGATTQVQNSYVEMFEEGKFISLRIKAGYWNSTDRVVDLRFDSIGENKTRVFIDYSAKLTACRAFVIDRVWGPKWAPIFYRLDGKKNKETLNQITDYLRFVPKWDHKYIYGDSFGERQVA